MNKAAGQIFRIGTVRYAEGLWRMRIHGPVIVHCTDSEDFPAAVLETFKVCMSIISDKTHKFLSNYTTFYLG